MVPATGAYAPPSVPAGCTAADFCNTQAGADLVLPVNHIAATALNLTGTCAATLGNLNPNPATAAFNSAYGAVSPGFTMCQAAAGTAGGSFVTAGNFTLTIPASTAAGTFVGMVEYLVV